MAAGRTPLMAGNWKMNLDHHAATHFVQKLAWSLKDAKHDFGSVEVTGLPPVTDLRPGQHLVDAGKLANTYRRQAGPRHAPGSDGAGPPPHAHRQRPMTHRHPPSPDAPHRHKH